MINMLDVLKLQLTNLETLRELALSSDEYPLAHEIEIAMLELFNNASYYDPSILESSLFIQIDRKQKIT